MALSINAPRVRETISSVPVSEEHASAFLTKFLTIGGQHPSEGMDDEDFLAEEEVMARLTALRNTLEDGQNHLKIEATPTNSQVTPSIQPMTPEERKRSEKEKKTAEKDQRRAAKKEKKEMKRKRRESKEARSTEKKAKIEDV